MEAGVPQTHVRRSNGVLVGILIAVFLLAVLGAGLWWYSFVRSPAYSVGRIAHAVETRDWAEFETYVDVDSVVSYAADDALENLVDPDSQLGQLAAKVGDSLKPALVEQGTKILREAIESGRIRVDNRFGPLGSYALAVSTKTVERGDEGVVVRVPVPLASQRVGLLLRMERVNDIWRVTRVENAADLPLVGVQ
ncbi:MAG: DUF2939 domain-containing protein [Coriobacteriia bacterium]